MVLARLTLPQLPIPGDISPSPFNRPSVPADAEVLRTPLERPNGFYTRNFLTRETTQLAANAHLPPFTLLQSLPSSTYIPLRFNNLQLPQERFLEPICYD